MKEILEKIQSEPELLKIFPNTDANTIDASKAIIQVYINNLKKQG